MAATAQADFPKIPLDICVHHPRFLPVITGYLFSLKGYSHKAGLNFVMGQMEEKVL